MARIRPQDCADIRRRYDEGHYLARLAEEYGVTKWTVRYHAYGDCTHEPGVEPLRRIDDVVAEA